MQMRRAEADGFCDGADDARLDDALAGTFPASDPVAVFFAVPPRQPTLPTSAAHQEDNIMADRWLVTLITDTPQAGFDLAMKMSRMGVKVTQSSDEIRKQLRAAYDHDTAQLIATSQVIAINFQTVAAANGYWR
jgi:Hexameric tyrosine-coordinated heme protein (HTHP)